MHEFEVVLVTGDVVNVTAQYYCSDYNEHSFRINHLDCNKNIKFIENVATYTRPIVIRITKLS